MRHVASRTCAVLSTAFGVLWGYAANLLSCFSMCPRGWHPVYLSPWAFYLAALSSAAAFFLLSDDRRRSLAIGGLVVSILGFLAGAVFLDAPATAAFAIIPFGGAVAAWLEAPEDRGD